MIGQSPSVVNTTANTWGLFNTFVKEEVKLTAIFFKDISVHQDVRLNKYNQIDVNC